MPSHINRLRSMNHFLDDITDMRVCTISKFHWTTCGLNSFRGGVRSPDANFGANMYDTVSNADLSR